MGSRRRLEVWDGLECSVALVGSGVRDPARKTGHGARREPDEPDAVDVCAPVPRRAALADAIVSPVRSGAFSHTALGRR